MTLIKYHPAREIDAFFNHMARDFWPSAYVPKGKETPVASRLPRTNIRETENEYLFTMEVPGLSKKDIEVTVEGDELTVRGAKTEESNEDTKGLIRREIRSQRFERTFDLAGAVDGDGIKAKIENGLLTVTLPKKPEKVGRKIDVS
jgi:HSP20 family protein